jgi:hypothetical protein
MRFPKHVTPVLALTCTASLASAGIIDFDSEVQGFYDLGNFDPSSNLSSNSGDPLATDLVVETDDGVDFGFRSVGSADQNDATRIVAASGGNAVRTGNFGGELYFSPVDGSTFDLNGFDLSGPFGQAVTANVTGFFDGGGTITQFVSTPGSVVSFSFAGFDNLTSVKVDYDTAPGETRFGDVDNINVTVIPIPEPMSAAAGGIMVGLLSLRRRR